MVTINYAHERRSKDLKFEPENVKKIWLICGILKHSVNDLKLESRSIALLLASLQTKTNATVRISKKGRSLKASKYYKGPDRV